MAGRPRWRGLVATLAWVAGSLAAVGCGSEVVISDEEDSDLELPLGEGGGEPGDVAPGICFPCAAGTCSICAELPSATHRCNEGQPGPECIQLGGLFDDGNGSYYTCWSCSP